MERIIRFIVPIDWLADKDLVVNGDCLINVYAHGYISRKLTEQEVDDSYISLQLNGDLFLRFNSTEEEFYIHRPTITKPSEKL